MADYAPSNQSATTNSPFLFSQLVVS
uniref:Uncharacterized protein n=1 Tax=Anguilla anguilla TaxID=7936 RepID=A0A0E9SHB5_ANGAN